MRDLKYSRFSPPKSDSFMSPIKLRDKSVSDNKVAKVLDFQLTRSCWWVQESRWEEEEVACGMLAGIRWLLSTGTGEQATQKKQSITSFFYEWIFHFFLRLLRACFAVYYVGEALFSRNTTNLWFFPPPLRLDLSRLICEHDTVRRSWNFALGALKAKYEALSLCGEIDESVEQYQLSRMCK